MRVTASYAFGRAFVAVALAVLTPTPALAQDAASPVTREEEAAAARRAKAAQLTPPPTDRVEGAFKYVEESRIAGRLFNPPSGWLIRFGGMSEGNGLGVGAGYRIATGHGRVDVGGVVSSRASLAGDVSWQSDARLHRRAWVEARAAASRDAQLAFFGAGPDSLEDARTGYSLRSNVADAYAHVRPVEWLDAFAGVGHTTVDVRQSASSRFPMTEDVYDEATLPGVQESGRFAVFTTGVVADNRDSANARIGGRYAIVHTRYADTDGDAFDFARTEIGLQQFVPFWHRTRVLALNVAAVATEAAEGSAVPFYFQPTVGGSRTLRGYSRQRFRDTASVLAQLEYRYEVNPFVMGALFVDAGQVAASWSDFDSDDLRTDYGFGVRVGYTAVGLRTDVAFGGEGTRVIVAFSGVF